MFTVLIAEKEHIEAIKRDNKLFFEPFLNNKDVAFCCWNPMGQNLYDSVPELTQTVGRRKEWRAVIINRQTAETITKRNPFDVVDNSAVTALVAPKARSELNESIEAWEEAWKAYYDELKRQKEAVYRSALDIPLQRLTTWLCFKAEDYILDDVEEKQDVHEWALDMISRDEEKPGVKLELMEREQYKWELRTKEKLRREFINGWHINIAYPSDVHCIAIRTAKTGFFDPDTYWNTRLEHEYSAFALRNMYFDKMRFMVFDLLPKDHRSFRSDYIRFLASVLIFISNPVPSSALRARRLYNLEVENDDTPLFTLVTSYDEKLASTYDVIEAEMEKIRSEIPGKLSDKAAEALFCKSTDIAVMLDGSCDNDKLYCKSDFGLFHDTPENEFYKWHRERRESEKALSYMVKQQSRSIKRSVGQMHMASRTTDANISRLTPLQINDIRDYTDAAEDDMVEATPNYCTDPNYYAKRIKDEDERVNRVLDGRMTKKTTLALGAVCLGLYLICFLPFLFANNGNFKTVLTALVLIGAVLVILAAVLYIVLFLLRGKLKAAVSDYNYKMKIITNEISDSLKAFSAYLSACCNVRRGHAVQNFAANNTDEYTKSLRIRKKHQQDIRKLRACLIEEYGDYLADKTYCDETMTRPYEYNFELKTEYKYPMPFLAGDCRQIEFISGGNLVTVPSSYITSILVRLEEIYEG